MTDEQIEIMRDPERAPTAKLPRIEDAVNAGGFLTGSADEIIDHLKTLEAKYPALDRISVSLSVGVPKSEALEQLQRFAEEVMPAFKKARVAVPGTGEVAGPGNQTPPLWEGGVCDSGCHSWRFPATGGDGPDPCRYADRLAPPPARASRTDAAREGDRGFRAARG